MRPYQGLKQRRLTLRIPIRNASGANANAQLILLREKNFKEKFWYNLT